MYQSNPEFGLEPSFYLTSPYAAQYSPLPVFREATPVLSSGETRNDTTAGLAPSGVRRTDSLGLVDMPITGTQGAIEQVCY